MEFGSVCGDAHMAPFHRSDGNSTLGCPCCFRSEFVLNSIVAMADITEFVSPGWADWYETEVNTAALIKSVISNCSHRKLSADDVWHLLRLTWITSKGGEPVPDHWKRLKIPALAGIFGKQGRILDDLDSTLAVMDLPNAVAEAARNETGIVNFRSVWRNSSREWCQTNLLKLRTLIIHSTQLSSNDQARLELAAEIEQLPSVPSPSGAGHVGAPALLTPLVACLDPMSRFPIINGQVRVRQLLRKWSLAGGGLPDQVWGLVNLVGQFGITDAFMIDAFADMIADLDPQIGGKPATPMPIEEGSSLPYFDEAERTAVARSESVVYRDRHDKMTNALKTICKQIEIKRGVDQNCRYDALLKNYNGKGRDLLIEVKPDPDKGSMRIAIGQLFDYRRFLPHRAGTDLAILTIRAPEQIYVDLLLDLQISCLWFYDENCHAIDGIGKSWISFKSAIKV